MPVTPKLSSKLNLEINAYLNNLISDETELSSSELARVAESRFSGQISHSALYQRITRLRQVATGLQQAVEADTETDLIKDQLIGYIRSGKTKTLTELANALDVSPKVISDRLNLLSSEGYNIEVREDTTFVKLEKLPSHEPFRRIKLDNYVEGKWQKFGVVSDTHLCSTFERLDVLHALYDIFEDEGITTVYLPGNYIDGVTSFNMFQLKTPVGFDKQLDYFLEKFPQKPGIKTYFIDGDEHEGWYFRREGIVPGRHLENMAQEVGRDDLVFLGYMEADVSYITPEGRTIVRLFHPKRGTAYAISYSPQKIVESYQGGEKPDIVLLGHFHKAEYMPTYRNIHIIQCGCTQDQSLFMRGKSLEAHIGGWVIQFKQRPLGSVCRLRAEFIGFYDRAYHIKHEFTEEKI